jgi:hypothetical protein
MFTNNNGELRELTADEMRTVEGGWGQAFMKVFRAQLIDTMGETPEKAYKQASTLSPSEQE